MDHSERAQSRIHWQYRGAEKLREWIDTLPAIAEAEIEEPAQLVADILDIDARSGEQLDIIGRIVGIDRPSVTSRAETAAVVQLATDDSAVQLGEGGAQLSSDSPALSEEVSDGLMRVLIKAKIERNNGDATIDNIIEAARYVAGFDDVTVNDNQDMTWSVSFGQELDSTTRFAFRNFDILPRPDATRFLGFIESPSLTQLGASFAQLGDARAQLNEVFI
jgi:hypothetical protein